MDPGEPLVLTEGWAGLRRSVLVVTVGLSRTGGQPLVDVLESRRQGSDRRIAAVFPQVKGTLSLAAG